MRGKWGRCLWSRLTVEKSNLCGKDVTSVQSWLMVVPTVRPHHCPVRPGTTCGHPATPQKVTGRGSDPTPRVKKPVELYIECPCLCLIPTTARLRKEARQPGRTQEGRARASVPRPPGRHRVGRPSHHPAQAWGAHNSQAPRPWCCRIRLYYSKVKETNNYFSGKAVFQ